MMKRMRKRISDLIAPKEPARPEPKTIPEWYEYMDDQPVIEI